MTGTTTDPLRKVFGIGFHKTGTTSLARALTSVGYRVTGPNGTGRRDIASEAWPLCARLIPKFDGFADNPWPMFFERLDEHCPGAAFVLTTRPTEEWLASVVGHFGATETPMRRWIYGAGSPLGNEDRYVDVYRSHNEAVRRHFAQRPDDFAEIELGDGSGWAELGRLIGVEVPDEPFPHANRAADTAKRLVKRRVSARHVLDRIASRRHRP